VAVDSISVEDFRQCLQRWDLFVSPAAVLQQDQHLQEATTLPGGSTWGIKDKKLLVGYFVISD
jgi:hypothetical protein